MTEPRKPIKLADGSLVYPDGRVVPPGSATDRVSFPPSDSTRDQPLPVVAVRRKLADLPDVPKVMNPVCVVLAYSLWGMDSEDIAAVTNLKVSQVAGIKLSAAYQSMHDDLVRGILHSESDDIRDKFVQHARQAASTVVDVMHTASKAEVRLKAAADILDRSGFRPNDVVEHRHRLEGGLTIEVVRKDEREVPTIDMEPDA